MEISKRAADEKTIYCFIGSYCRAFRLSYWPGRWAVGPAEHRESRPVVRALFFSRSPRNAPNRNSFHEASI
jgi:hypothetical protein